VDPEPHPDVAGLVARMEGLLRPLEAEGSPGRFFLATYLRTTCAVEKALAEGAFEDPHWVARWDVDFAGLYLDALEAHRRDRRPCRRPGDGPSTPIRRCGPRRTCCSA
jgi:uncharacterized protein DUF5995